MPKKKHDWSEFFEKESRPTYKNPPGKTEDELWLEWKSKHYKSLSDIMFEKHLN